MDLRMLPYSRDFGRVMEEKIYDLAEVTDDLKMNVG